MQTLSGKLLIDYNDQPLHLPYGEPHIRVAFPIQMKLERSPALRYVRELLKANTNVSWLRTRGNAWYLDFSRLSLQMPTMTSQFPWMRGSLLVEPNVLYEEGQLAGRPHTETVVQFIVTEEEAVSILGQRIFLSHKGIDKPRVKEFANALRGIGFDPWLDEDAMAAGVELERGLLQGMEDSCAAVFFITPHFEDSGFPATEVNYAMAEKREKGVRFAIISLVLAGDDGRRGAVPELLRQFVFKEPLNDLQALHEIVRAVPLQVVGLEWRA
jgi:hypothetical protein